VNLDRIAAAWPLLRDIACVVVALGGLIYEAAYGGPVRPELILAYVGLLGSPVFLRKDDRDRGDDPRPKEVE
jgi:hypothetical protein